MKSMHLHTSPRTRNPQASLLMAALTLALLALQHPAQAALDVKIQANPAPAAPGEVIAMTLVVTNSSGFNRSGVTLKMPYPVGLDALSNSLIEGASCLGNYCEPTEVLTWNLGSLPAGKTAVLTLPPAVAAATLPGSLIQFNAEVTDSGASKATAVENIEIVNSRVLQLHMSKLKQDPVQAAQVLNYQLSFGHTASSAAASNAVLEMPLPVGTSFVSASDTGFLVGNTVQWNLGHLLPGQVGERRVSLMLDPAAVAGTVQKSEANLRADAGKKAHTELLTRIEEDTGLALALDLNASPAKPTETLNAKVTVSNTSFFDRANVELHLRYPVGLEPLSNSLIDIGGCVGNYCEPNERSIWSLGTLAAGQSKTITLPPQVAMAALPGTLIAFSAQAKDSSGSITGADELVQVVNSRVLQLSLTELTPSPAQAGQKLIYQLGFGHSASSAVATGAQLSIGLPAGTSFVSASDGGSFSNGHVIWALGTLSPGQVGERRVVLSLDPDLSAGTLLKAEAALSADGAKLVRSDTITRVEEARGLRLLLDINASPATPTEPLSTKLTLSNTSFFDRSNVKLWLRFPVGLVALSNDLIEQGSCVGNYCEPTETLVWNLGGLGAGQSRTVTLPPVVDSATLPGSVIEFEAWASDSSGDVTNAFETITIINSRVLQLAVGEVGQEPVLPGSDISYQLDFGHSASSASANAAVMEVQIPPALSFVSASGGGVLLNGAVQWNLGNLLPGQVGKRQLTLRQDALPGQASGFVHKLEATLRDSAGRLVRADDTTRVEAEIPLALTLELLSNASQPGNAVQVKLSLSNNSEFDRTNMVMSTRFPAGLESLANTGLIGGSCVGNYCESQERIVWNLGTVPAHATVTKLFTPTVLNNLPKGSLIEFTAWAEDANNRARATQILRVGKEAATIIDTDGDGIPDGVDNCVLVKNPDQRDSDADGYGNMCDGDLDNNGIVNAIDLGKFKTFMGKTGPNLAADLDGNGIVNLLDLGRLKTLFGKPPGPSGNVPK